MTDDQTLASFTPEVMPRTWDLFHDERSATFERAIASPPLCCPARAGFLTGQYPHNHGILANSPGYAELVDKPNVLPTWLDRIGYRTTMVGKYLNHYEAVAGSATAPGWDSWNVAIDYPAYYDYPLNQNGVVEQVGSGPRDYSTRRFTEIALEELRRGGRDPAFMWLAYNAPHIAPSKTKPCDGELAEPPDRDAYEEFAEAEPPRDPSFDEEDRSDKPRAIKTRTPLTPHEMEGITRRWRCGLATLRVLDGQIGRLADALEKADELERTVLVFVSDNGYFFGAHALEGDKRLPYSQSSHVPMAIRVGSRVSPEPPPPTIGQTVSNVDLAPTLLDYAGTRPCIGDRDCRELDGRSLRPLLEGRDQSWPSDRAVLMELDDGHTYTALRTDRYLYTEITADRAGELREPAIELYDLVRDPYELDNLATLEPEENSKLLDELAARLDRLTSCSGKDCE